MCPLAIDPPIVNQRSVDTLKTTVDDLVDNELYLNKDFLKMLQEDYYYHHVYKSPNYLFNQTKFLRLLSQWNEEILFSSDANKMMSSHLFNELVKMGIPIIPFILEQLRDNPNNTLVWVLNRITNSKISRSTISLEDAAHRWLQWGREHKLI